MQTRGERFAGGATLLVSRRADHSNACAVIASWGYVKTVNLKVALGWLAREDWPKWQEVEPLLPPYDEWLVKVEARYREAHERGVQFELIRLEPTQFAAWCKVKGLAPGKSSRAEYATAALARRPK